MSSTTTATTGSSASAQSGTPLPTDSSSLTSKEVWARSAFRPTTPRGMSCRK
ncbi:hypothetical protein LINGRAHAP2_LOCUS15522 [Linum grandiflorum]